MPRGLSGGHNPGYSSAMQGAGHPLRELRIKGRPDERQRFRITPRASRIGSWRTFVGANSGLLSPVPDDPAGSAVVRSPPQHHPELGCAGLRSGVSTRGALRPDPDPARGPPLFEN